MRVCGIGTPGFAVVLVLVHVQGGFGIITIQSQYNHNTIQHDTIPCNSKGGKRGERERYSIIAPKPGKKLKKNRHCLCRVWSLVHMRRVPGPCE